MLEILIFLPDIRVGHIGILLKLVRLAVFAEGVIRRRLEWADIGRATLSVKLEHRSEGLVDGLDAHALC